MLEGLKSRSKRGWFFWISGGLLTFAYLYPLPSSLEKDFSTVILFSDGKIMRVYLTRDEKWRIYLPLEKIDSLLVKTTILYEDRYFWYHPGVNPLSIIRALFQNIKARKIVSGASTLSMQLARILEPKPRTLRSKIIEAFRAIQFEIKLGKKKILELYLNLAPYSRNYEGVGAASLAYLHKLPKNLTPQEVAFLVSLPQAPSTPEEKRKGRNRVLERMKRYGVISEEEYLRALKEPVPYTPSPLPCYAPHAADFLHLLYPEEKEIHSTIEFELQKKVENIIASYRGYVNSHGASNISAVVIENKTRKVRVLIGSFDYWDESIQGQVRGFEAYRSPGSALKPFLYALAIQEGVIHPQMLIEDAPHVFGDFAPHNYSRQWRGLVTAEEALCLSLNLPFVLLLERTGYEKFVGLLKKAGIKGPLPYSEYGLPIITGGMDVKLIDLTNFYVTLARGGLHGPWIIREEETPEEFPLLNPGAVLLTLQALSKRNRPDAPSLSGFIFPKSKIYWKTGTSWGRRDAWSIGFGKHYTVGVWCGNFDGRGGEEIVGAILAAPVMFDILRAIEPPEDKPFEWEEIALEEIDSIWVCAFSGYRPQDACPSKKKVAVLKNAHPPLRCPFHKKILVEKKTGYRACPWKKYKKGELVEKICVVYPPSVKKVLKAEDAIPPFPPDCKLASKESKIQILLPADGTTYFIPHGIAGAEDIPLLAVTSSREGKIYWFVNGRYMGSTPSGKIMYIPPPEGKLKILAQDTEGNSASAVIHVLKELP